MDWFKRIRKPREPQEKKEIPEGLWLKCNGCGEILYRTQLEKNLSVCDKCGYHFRISAQRYAEILLDANQLIETDGNLSSIDTLNFPEYKKKLKESREKVNLKDALLCGEGKIGEHSIIIALMDFSFMGGSMGSVVGEKVSRTIRRAREKSLPLIILSASGGARMQEGIFSLMQLVKTSAALAELAQKKIPYISILTNPTTAGVMASFGSLGDIILAEPGALIGFTGPRVIQQTIGQELPEGFQRSEFLLKHGQIDVICKRHDLKKTLVQILNFFNETKKDG
jgi:acetyl-CoA carboxylase carboxyl transferase subunit beta